MKLRMMFCLVLASLVVVSASADFRQFLDASESQIQTAHNQAKHTATTLEISPDRIVITQQDKQVPEEISLPESNREVPLETTAAWMSPDAYAVGGLRWADMNDDGWLDLVTVHYEGGFPARPEETRVWYNQNGTLESTASYVSTDTVWSTDVSIADIDQNGYLDIYVVNYGANVIHFQDESGISTTPSWTSSESFFSLSAGIGDITGTGYPDISVANQGVSPNPEKPNHMYGNTTGIPANSAFWTSADEAQHMSCALGDYDEDDIVQMSAQFTGDGTRSLFTVMNVPIHSILGVTINSVATNDYVVNLRDGWIILGTAPEAGIPIDINYETSQDLDMAVAVDHGNAKIYHDTGSTLETTPSFAVSGTGDRREKTISWVDLDNDGDLDLFVGGRGVPSMVYDNEMGTINPVAIWSSSESEPSMSDVDWIDMDKDGDLDAACSSTGDSDFDTLWVHENINGVLETEPSWVLPYGSASSMCNACAWGDMNGDGWPDLAAAYSGAEIRVFLNTGASQPPTPTPTPSCNNNGDVNQDNELTSSDAQLAFMIALGSYTPNWLEGCSADCNGDWDWTAGDAQQIFMAVLSSGSCVDPLD